MTQAADSLLESLRKKLRDEMNAITDHLAGGGCPDIETYRHLTGKIEGIAYSEMELLALDERLNNQ